jgi:hypothetical protein
MMMEMSSIMLLMAVDKEKKIKSINKEINSNWVDVCEKYQSEEIMLKKYHEMAFDYWNKRNINLELQAIGNDSATVIENIVLYEEWLNEIRKRNFIKMETKQLHHQTNQQHRYTSQTHLQQPLREFFESTQQQYQEWRQQIRKPPEEWKITKENTHITYHKPRGSNPLLLGKRDRPNTIIRRSMQLVKDNITKLKFDSIFGEKDRQLLVFLEEEFYDLNSSNIRLNDKKYYTLQDYHYQVSPKEELALAGNDGQLDHSVGSLKIIEKRSTF